MATSLYRQYRPQTFSEVVGQNHIKVTLQNAINQGKLAHAYLFAGPRGIGKTTIARLLAKVVNCQGIASGEAEPCNKCSACEEITNGHSLDVVEMDAASHTGVDNIRENIIETARFTPAKLKFKVFIIDEVHMLSISAFNALLKIMEEPPSHVIFILCTTEIHKIPTTIISRCQRFDFKKVSQPDIINHLNSICKKEGFSCDKEVLQNIARHSEGYLRDAIGLLGQVFSLGEKKINLKQAELVLPRSNFLVVAEFVNHLAGKDLEKALQLINQLVDEGVNIHQFTLDLIEFTRKLLLTKISGSLDKFALSLDEAGEKNILNLLGKLDLSKIILMIDIFLAKNQALRSSAIVQLPLELAAIEICGELGTVWSLPESSPKPKVVAAKSESLNKTEPKEPKAAVSSQDEIKEIKKERGPVTSVTLVEIQKKWGELVRHLSDSNHSLALTLRIGQPLEVRDDVVIIGFQYKFHQEKINEAKSRSILAQALGEVLGKKMRVEAVVSDKALIEIRDDKGLDESLSGVLNAFGGKVVS